MEIEYKHDESSDEKLNRMPYGEWIEEADEAHFIYKGIKCEILRNDFGSLCGYCYLPEDHPWLELNDKWEVPVEVHGGITYFEKIKIGFDCAHSGDISPINILYDQKIKKILLQKNPEMKNEQLFKRTYKNMNFVIEQCKKLADQIIEAQKIKQEE